MNRNQRVAWTIILLIALSRVAAASVIVSPSSAQLKPGAQLQFSTTGAANDVVIWGLMGAGCSGISCGEITADGLYTAPAIAPSPSTVTVTATSLSDLSQAGTATVTIGSPTSVAVFVSPSSVTLSVKGQQQFAASVTGSSNTGVRWSVSGTGCVAGSCGSISPTGLYTAPPTVPTPALATVTATSLADPTKSNSASVLIQLASAVSVSVVPATAQVFPGG